MAAASSSGACPVEDSLSCDVCFEKYNSSDHLPKSLPCPHTFCASCVQSLISEAAAQAKTSFECPVCRKEVDLGDEIPTNQAVRDIVDAVAVKDRSKLFCSHHPGEECIMFCSDCCQTLCKVCVKGLAKGVHIHHEIDTIESGKVALKARLSKKLKEKIAGVEKSISGLDQLAADQSDYVKELDAVVAKINATVKTWKDNQLAGRQSIIEKQRAMFLAQKEEWQKKLAQSDFHEMLNLYEAVKDEVASCKRTPDVSLQFENTGSLPRELLNTCADLPLQGSQAKTGNRVRVSPSERGPLRLESRDPVDFRQRHAQRIDPIPSWVQWMKQETKPN